MFKPRSRSVITFLLFALACGCVRAPSREQAGLEAAISRLRSGAVISSLNERRDSTVFVDSRPDAGEGASVPEPSAGDPCSAIPALREADAPSFEQWNSALKMFQSCISDILAPQSILGSAMTYLKIFNRGVTERALSQMSDAELKAFVMTSPPKPMSWVGRTSLEAPLRTQLRNSFTERDLDELVRLASRRNKALAGAESAIFALVDAHRGLIEHFAGVSNRYQLLLALRDSAGDTIGIKTADLIAPILVKAGLEVPKNLAIFPVSYFHPTSIIAIPTPTGRELLPLDPHESPFVLVRALLGNLGGSLATVSIQRKVYAGMRDGDNPPMPSHEAPAADAVRLAVLDTGVDFVQYPELGLFLSDGTPGTVGSYDFADEDTNPYLFANGSDSHGSGTTASVLTILAHQAPEVLRSRRLDLAVWKTNTNRSLLAGPYHEQVSWDNRSTLADSIILRASDADSSKKPQILSVSWAFDLADSLLASGKPDALLQAPWLWVMAAGNFGVDAAKAQAPVCLTDVPADKRIDARILCVGALKRGIIDDKIAAYSDFGDRVDVYAYESYIQLCPNGTSCATPAVSGAAAILAARFPGIKPEQIKRFIVEAAEVRELSVDGGRKDAEGKPVRMKVRVFDPLTMTARALQLAEGALTAEPITSIR